MKLSARLTMAICLAVFVFGLFASSASYAELVALWLFDDEDEGDEIKDSSGKENNGKILGAEWIDGKFGTALEFKDVGDFVDVGGNIQPGESMSVVAWIYNYGVPGDYGMMLVKWRGGNNNSYDFTLFHDELAFFIYDKGNTMFRLNESANHPERIVAKKQWTHIAAVADSAAKKMKIYLNAEEVGSLDYSGTIKQLGSAAGLGNRDDRTERFQFLGIIDEFAVFDHALTEQEIKNIMDKGLEVAVLGKPEKAVLSSWKLATTWAQLKSEY